MMRGAVALAICGYCVTAGAQTGDAAKRAPTTKVRFADTLAVDVRTDVLRQADRAVQTGDFADAARGYAAAALRAPGDTVLRLLTGVALTTANKPTDAVTQFKAACRLTGDDLLASLLLQGALAQTGQAAEAQTVYLDAVRRFGKPTGGMDTSASLVRLKAALKAAPESPILYLLLGDVYQIAENFPAAGAAYQKAMLLSPRWAKPQINLGLLKLAQGKPAEATLLFEAALMREPQNTEVLFFRADALRQSGNLRGAIATYQRIETRATNRKTPAVAAQALTGLGQAYAASGRFDDAEIALNKARVFAPTDPAPPAALGEVQTQKKEFDAAAQNYADALRLTKASGLFGGTQAVLYEALAQTQLAAKEPNAALQTLDRALRDEPASAGVWQRIRGTVLLSQGSQTEAETAFRASLDAQTGAGVFPQETLATLAANNLLDTLTAGYRADLSPTEAVAFANPAAQAGAPVVVRGATKMPDGEVKAFAALAAIAQYRGDTEQETAHREAVCRLRGRGTDFYGLADAYDGRARDTAKAKAAYQKALAAGDLSDAQKERARLRIKQLGGTSIKP